jgi:hypothetical protein
MPVEYEFKCPRGHGRFTTRFHAPTFPCPVCGEQGKRVYASVQIGAVQSSSGYEGWNPVVGQYVANKREFDVRLNEAREREFAKTGMEPKWVEVDSRDTGALNELHGMTQADRDADLEGTRRNLHDAEVT